MDIKPLMLVNQKYENAHKKREAWEKKFHALVEKIGKAKSIGDKQKAVKEVEKMEATRRKADMELVKASDERDKRVRELTKAFS